MKARYITPFTDFGFKKIFGGEASKPMLIDFLNSVLPADLKIRDLSFKNTEQLGKTEIDRRAIYDIYCESESGEKFIVELQKAKQDYFRERTVYYSTFPIAEQAQKGFWDYNLKAVFCIGILDFKFSDYENEIEKGKIVHVIKLKDQQGKVFYDKLTYIYLEMPNFKKEETELDSRLDKWLYFIKHLEDFQNIPGIFKDEVFERAFEKAELSKLAPSEQFQYENSLKIARDLKNTFDYAVGKGWEQGYLKGVEERLSEYLSTSEVEAKLQDVKLNLKAAKILKYKNVDIQTITRSTGLSENLVKYLNVC